MLQGFYLAQDALNQSRAQWKDHQGVLEENMLPSVQCNEKYISKQPRMDEKKTLDNLVLILLDINGKS